MANEQWLMEWVDASHIRTFERERAGGYTMLRPQMNDTFDVQAAKTADYEKYWTAWTKYAGYTAQNEVDICLVCPDTVNVNDFLSSAKSTGIHIASPTAWSVQDVLECLEQTGRYAKSEPSESSPVKITLDDGVCLYAHSGDGGDFRPSEIREIAVPLSDEQEETHQDDIESDSQSFAAEEEMVQTPENPAQATKEELREAFRRISQEQCRTIDNRR